MSDIIVASEDVRTASGMTVNQAVRDHADPDGVAELLAPPEDSATAEESADRTLDEFAEER